MKVFTDTSGFYAALAHSDGMHELAQATLTRLIRRILAWDSVKEMQLTLVVAVCGLLVAACGGGVSGGLQELEAEVEILDGALIDGVRLVDNAALPDVMPGMDSAGDKTEVPDVEAEFVDEVCTYELDEAETTGHCDNYFPEPHCLDASDCTPKVCMSIACEICICVWTPKEGCCKDDAACITNAPCEVGKCVGYECVTLPKNCQDGEAASVDICDPVTGDCVHCWPDCSGKQCGDDGCGGNCGTCSGQFSCVGSQCVCPTPPAPVFEIAYGGEFLRSVSDLVVNPAGGITLVGTTDLAPFYDTTSDFWLLATDGNGNALWEQVFGGPEKQGSETIVLAEDGGYAFSGADYYPQPIEGPSYHGWRLVRLDTLGNTLWDKPGIAGSDDYTPVPGLAAVPGGGWILAGCKSYTYSSKQAQRLIRTDSAGETLWEKTYGGLYEQRCGNRVVALPDGGFAVAGRLHPYGVVNTDLLLLRTDADGSQLWEQTCVSTGYYGPHALLALPGGGFLVAGEKSVQNTAGYDFHAVRTDAQGNMLWEATYGGTKDEYLDSAVAMPGGGFVLAGRRLVQESDWGGTFTWWVVRTDGVGNLLWQASGEDVGSPLVWRVAAAADASGSIWIGTSPDGMEGADDDVHLIRFAPECQ